MKKLFFYAAAAVAMLASCQKNEIASVPVQTIDDSKAAAILFGIDAPALTVTPAVKGAVDAWDSTKVFVYGIKEERNANLEVLALGAGRYDFSDILINDYETFANPTRVTEFEGLSALAVYADKTTEMPYYYAEGETYDFFGYHLGGAYAGAADKTATDVITYPVTIYGNNDVMVAHTVRKNDVKKADAVHGVLESDLYSAWAARRAVQPTLKFKHALTRFNFIVKGEGNAAGGKDDFSQVTITGIKLADMATEGTLTVVGDTAALGFVADYTANLDTLALKTVDATGNVDVDVTYVPEVVTVNTNGDAAGNGSCLMVAPNLESVKVVVNMVNNKFNNEPLPNYDFEVKAESIKGANGQALGAGAKFEAGKSYNIIIKVKGPKDIQIEAALTDWVDGGDYEYDSDIRPGGAQTPVTPATPVAKDYIDNLKPHALVETGDAAADKKAYEETLPAYYVEGHPFESIDTFPWVGATFDLVKKGTFVLVTVYYDGVQVQLDQNKISWGEVDGGRLFCTNNERDFSYVGFEVEGELGLDPEELDMNKFEVKVEIPTES